VEKVNYITNAELIESKQNIIMRPLLVQEKERARLDQ
jgi:hypothetical protein